jgi:hypothetical protein
MSSVAVGLVSHADRMEPFVGGLFRRNVPRARTLPYVAFVDADGNWICGFSGARSVGQFLGDLSQAEGAQAQWLARQPSAAPTQHPPEPPAEQSPEQEQPCCPGGICEVPDAPSEHLPLDPELDLPSAPRVAEADRSTPDRSTPERASPEGAPTQPGDGPAHGSTGGAEREQPDPQVRTVPSPQPPVIAEGSPDGNAPPVRPIDPQQIVPASTTVAEARRAAEQAAVAGQWGRVLRLTQGHAALEDLAEQARRWAETTLETSARLLEAGRIEVARRGIEAVATEFEDTAAAIDAERGLEALETLDELRYLAPESVVRRSVRQRAYESLRGSRWARLFE